MGQNFTKQLRAKRGNDRGEEKEEEEPEEFLQCLLVENWDLTKATFDELPEEK